MEKFPLKMHKPTEKSEQFLQILLPGDHQVKITIGLQWIVTVFIAVSSKDCSKHSGCKEGLKL